MTTARESELLTRVGPGTPMGTLMRNYWLPALKSSELVADGDPVRFKLLGEELIAFRDSAGRVGVMDHRCPHRCASLFFGRNEEGGIRCVYHGWKFDVDGKCLDMANVPPHQDFKHKVHAKAYKATERTGLVWVYMGERQDAPPPLPAIESHLLPESEVTIDMAMRDCNWLQALEGDIDTSHFSFLHIGSTKLDELPEGDLSRYQILNKTPEFASDETPWGTMYAAFRPALPGQNYWRIAHFMFPCFTMQPNGDFSRQIGSRAWVPLDDTHVMFIQVNWTGMKRATSNTTSGKPLAGSTGAFECMPNSTDWLGRWRITRNMGNDYLIDREAQRNDVIYTGISGIHTQDQAVTESMGGIVDHTFEHLAPSDLMITQTRRRILRALQAFQTDGTLPPGIEDPSIYLGARGGHFMWDAATDWRDAYAEQLRRAQNPTGRLLQAAE